MRLVNRVRTELDDGYVKAAFGRNSMLVLDAQCERLLLYVRCELVSSRPIREFVARNRVNATCIDLVCNESGTMAALYIRYGAAAHHALVFVPVGELFTVRWNQHGPRMHDMHPLHYEKSFSMVFWSDDLLLVSLGGKLGRCPVEGEFKIMELDFPWVRHLNGMSQDDRRFHSTTNPASVLIRATSKSVYYAIYGRVYVLYRLVADRVEYRPMRILNVGAIVRMSRIWRNLFLTWDGYFTLSVVNVVTGVVLERMPIYVPSTGHRLSMCFVSTLGTCVSVPVDEHEMRSLRMTDPSFARVTLYRDKHMCRVRCLQKMHYAAARKKRSLNEVHGSRGKIYLVTLSVEMFMSIVQFYAKMGPGQ